MSSEHSRLGRFVGWRDEMIGAVKTAVPMATADAGRAVDAVLEVVDREYTTLPKHAQEGLRIEWEDDE